MSHDANTARPLTSILFVPGIKRRIRTPSLPVHRVFQSPSARLSEAIAKSARIARNILIGLSREAVNEAYLPGYRLLPVNKDVSVCFVHYCVSHHYPSMRSYQP